MHLHPRMVALHYPPYWHYDVLVGLRTLASGRTLEDPRTANALSARVEATPERDLARGRALVEASWMKGPTSRQSTGEHAMNALLTERVRDVLRAAGRV